MNGWAFDEEACILLPKELQDEWSCLQCVFSNAVTVLESKYKDNSDCTLFLCIGERRWGCFLCALSLYSFGTEELFINVCLFITSRAFVSREAYFKGCGNLKVLHVCMYILHCLHF